MVRQRMLFAAATGVVAMLAAAACGTGGQRGSSYPGRGDGGVVHVSGEDCADAEQPLIRRDPSDVSWTPASGSPTVSFTTTICARARPAVMWQRQSWTVACTECAWTDMGPGSLLAVGAHVWRSTSPPEHASASIAGYLYRAVVYGPGGRVTTDAALLNVTFTPNGTTPSTPSPASTSVPTTTTSVASGSASSSVSPGRATHSRRTTPASHDVVSTQAVDRWAPTAKRHDPPTTTPTTTPIATPITTPPKPEPPPPKPPKPPEVPAPTTVQTTTTSPPTTVRCKGHDCGPAGGG